MTEQYATGTSRKRILRQGVVSSDKMDKTICVCMERQVKHPLYGKYIKQKTIFKAHDQHNAAFEGDLVEIEFCRPRSKTKRWQLVRVIKQGPASQLVQMTQAAQAAQESSPEQQGGAP